MNHWTLLMISQYHCSRQWLGTIGQQAITGAYLGLNLCHHIGPYEWTVLLKKCERFPTISILYHWHWLPYDNPNCSEVTRKICQNNLNAHPLTHWPLEDLDAIFKTAIVNLALLIDIFTSSNDYALRWMPWDLAGDKSTSVQVMAWCRQAASHYLSQCWPSCMSPYGVARPQWVNECLFSLKLISR